MKTLRQALTSRWPWVHRLFPSQEAHDLSSWIELFVFLAKIKLVILATVLVLFIPFPRPKVTHSYSTNDPSDNMRGGYRFSCACTVNPPSPTTAGDLDDISWISSRCYHRATLETMNILVYSNFTGVEKLEERLRAANPNKTSSVMVVDGLRSLNVSALYEDEYGRLFGKGGILVDDGVTPLYVRHQDEVVDVKVGQSLDTVSALFDSPTSFPTMALSFICHDCECCSLGSVNEALHSVFRHFNRIAGGCSYWELGDQCAANNHGFYMAKCTLLSYEAIPLALATDEFVSRLLTWPGIKSVRSVMGKIGDLSINYTSLLFTDFSRVKVGAVRLGFWELDRSSEAWYKLVDLYPTLDVDCFETHTVEIYNSVSICNAVSNRVHLWNTDGFNVEREDWFETLCSHHYQKRMHISPYLVLWDTILNLQTEPSDRFYRSISFTPGGNAGRLSGLCTKKHDDVLRQDMDDKYKKGVVFWEMICPREFSFGDFGRNHCWKTGRYHNFTDIPIANETTGWNTVEGFRYSEDFFRCYNVTDEWLFSTVIVLGLCSWAVNFVVSRVEGPLTALLRAWVKTKTK